MTCAKALLFEPPVSVVLPKLSDCESVATICAKALTPVPPVNLVVLPLMDWLAAAITCALPLSPPPVSVIPLNCPLCAAVDCTSTLAPLPAPAVSVRFAKLLMVCPAPINVDDVPAAALPVRLIAEFTDTFCWPALTIREYAPAPVPASKFKVLMALEQLALDAIHPICCVAAPFSIRANVFAPLPPNTSSLPPTVKI